jgi:hypothetical protein
VPAGDTASVMARSSVEAARTVALGPGDDGPSEVGDVERPGVPESLVLAGDGAALDGPALDGPALDGPALDGPALDGPAGGVSVDGLADGSASAGRETATTVANAATAIRTPIARRARPRLGGCVSFTMRLSGWG